jgi:hypothetical protein
MKKIAFLLLCYAIHSPLLVFSKNTPKNTTTLLKNSSSSLSKVNGDPVSLGMLFFGLKSIISDLETTVKNVTGDTKSQIVEVIGTLNGVADVFWKDFNTKMDLRVDQIEGLERKTIEDIENLIAISKPLVTLPSDISKIIKDTDILTYNIVSSVKRIKEPRIVYFEPSSIYAGDFQTLIKLKGNFLNNSEYPIFINDQEVQVISRNENEVIIRLGQNDLRKIQADSVLVVKTTPSIKKKNFFGKIVLKNGTTKSIAIEAKPEIIYQISGLVSPAANTPNFKDFKYDFYKKEDQCDASYPVDKIWTLPDGYKVENFSIHETASGGRSFVGGVHQEGSSSVFVRAQIAGKTVSIFNICKCRGDVGYVLNVRGKRYENELLPSYPLSLSIEANKQSSFVFEYPKNLIPLDNAGITWKYRISIKIVQGKAERIVELSDANPNHDVIKSSIKDGVLTLEFNNSII